MEILYTLQFASPFHMVGISRMIVCLYGKSLNRYLYDDLPVQSMTCRSSYNEVENPEWTNKVLRWQ